MKSSRPCLWCGTVFTSSNSLRMYHSAPCRNKAARSHPVVSHGLSGYERGCKCEICSEAKRQVYRARKLVSHGCSGYTAGCRCETCTAAVRASHRASEPLRRERARAADYETVKHGTRPGYDAGCRCPDCTGANTKVTRSSIVPRYERTLPGARNNGKEWTSADLEIVTRGDLTPAELAQLLGRTLYAVLRARQRARTDPKWLAIQGVRQATRPAARVLDKRGSER